MDNETLAAEKAEFIQSVKALMIPLSAFLACVIMAAGVFLVYHGEPVGWILCGVSALTVVAATIALIRFQNKYRARGIMKDAEDIQVEMDFSPSGRTDIAGSSTSTPSVRKTGESVVIPEPFALR